ncbi:MAG TPA: hypothetical protein VMM13_11230 [Euzebya sp.]|nr:hypothetical protein [Euzebya sp.]
MTTTPEPWHKLDTPTSPTPLADAGAAVVNGPKDEVLDWHATNWRAVEDAVRRLRHRIFTPACLSRVR